jgi:adenosyl cobinamide kinase/adenosyl cobinamide phosphate guanylyltransferase
MAINKTLSVQYDSSSDDYFIELPDDVLREAGFRPGDTLVWNEAKDGAWTLTKAIKETQLVLVECVTQFRHRYVVEVPVGKSEWALDTVTMEEAKEFSQEHLNETIVSHRVVSKEEALRLCNEDNDYARTWSDEKKIETFFTKIED